MRDEFVRRSVLPSGLRVVTESMPGARSVTIGMWVGSGARDEVDEQSGASHFLEHLLFKGTEERTALDIAAAVESVGGEMNAFTTHEQTVFYVRLPDTQLERAIDILADVVWRPAFRPDDVEAERQVILEEIGMRDDTPDDLVHDLFTHAHFPDHPLGREVLGTSETIAAMPRDGIASYHAAHYEPHNIVVAAAGKQAGSGTWRLLESDGARVTVLPGRQTRIVLRAHSRIKGSFMMGFSVDSEWKIVSVDVPEAAAAQEARP